MSNFVEVTEFAMHVESGFFVSPVGTRRFSIFVNVCVSHENEAHRIISINYIKSFDCQCNACHSNGLTHTQHKNGQQRKQNIADIEHYDHFVEMEFSYYIHLRNVGFFSPLASSFVVTMDEFAQTHVTYAMPKH